jgi:hypothetical protein
MLRPRARRSCRPASRRDLPTDESFEGPSIWQLPPSFKVIGFVQNVEHFESRQAPPSAASIKRFSSVGTGICAEYQPKAWTAVHHARRRPGTGFKLESSSELHGHGVRGTDAGRSSKRASSERWDMALRPAFARPFASVVTSTANTSKKSHYEDLR